MDTDAAGSLNLDEVQNEEYFLVMNVAVELAMKIDGGGVISRKIVSLGTFYL